LVMEVLKCGLVI